MTLNNKANNEPNKENEKLIIDSLDSIEHSDIVQSILEDLENDDTTQ